MNTLPELEPNSIKDRILASCQAIGINATRGNLRKSINGDSSIVEIAINGLVRDGYLILAENDRFMLHPELISQYEHLTQQETQVMTDTRIIKVCGGKHGCGIGKSLDEFYKGQACCKSCFNKKYDGKKKTTDGTAVAIKPNVKTKTSTKRQDGEFIIPASGELKCSETDIGITITQGADTIICSFDQAAALKLWIPASKKAS